MNTYIYYNKISFKIAILVFIMIGSFVTSALADDDFKMNRESFTIKSKGNLLNLTYGGIIEDSENVFVNGKALDKLKYEYSIDYGAATLIVNNKLSVGDYVSVDYFYKPNVAKVAATKSSALPTFSFTGNDSSMNFALAYDSVDAMTGDVTYGTSLKSNLGKQLSFNSYYYRNESGEANSAGNSGGFNMHDMQYNLGKGNITYSYQDISSSFDGFNYMKTSSGMDYALLSQLEKEKGLKRNTLGFNYDLGASGKFNLAYNTVSDSADDIKNTALSYVTGNMELNYNTSSIGNNFSRFNDIRESDRAVMAKEKGIDRTSLGLKYNIAGVGIANFYQSNIANGDKNIDYSTLNFTGSKFELSYLSREIDNGFSRYSDLRDADKDQWAQENGISRTNYQFKYNIATAENPIWQTYYNARLKDSTSSLSADLIDLSYKNIQFGYASIDTDKSFSRMAALDTNERNKFSAIANKMFNYNADANAVNDKDRASWVYQAGIDRTMIYSKYAISPDKTFLFTKNALDDGSGSLDMTNINYSDKQYKLWYNNQNIDRTFTKLASLTPTEIANFNNQYGMNRDKYGFETTTKLGYFKYSNDNIFDSVTKSSYLRNNFTYATNKIVFVRKFTDYDDTFTRIYDISDSDRASQAANKGYDRAEYNLNLKMGKTNQRLDLDIYSVDANKETTNDDIGQRLYQLTYVPDAKFNAYIYSDSYEQKNPNLTYIDNAKSIAKMTKILDFGKIKNVNIFSQYYTNSFLDGSLKKTDQKVIDLNIKSDQAQKFIVNLDYKSEDYDNGNIHKKYDLYANQKISDRFALTFGYGMTDSNLIDNESRLKYGVVYSVNDTFKLNYLIDNKLGGSEGDRINQSVSISGAVPKILPESIVSGITVDAKYDTKKVNEARDAYNSTYKLAGNLLKGAFLLEKSDILETTKKQWFVETDKLSYSNNNLFGTPLSINLEDKTTTQASGVKGDTKRYNFAYALSDKFSALYNAVNGNWKDNSYIAIETKEFGLTQKLNSLSNLTVKYTFNNNTNNFTQSEELVSLGYTAERGDKKGRWSVSAGVTTSRKNTGADTSDFTYNVSYEHRIASDSYLSLSAIKTTTIEGTTTDNTVDPETLLVNFRTEF